MIDGNLANKAVPLPDVSEWHVCQWPDGCKRGGVRLVDMPGVGELWLCRRHAGETWTGRPKVKVRKHDDPRACQWPGECNRRAQSKVAVPGVGELWLCWRHAGEVRAGSLVRACQWPDGCKRGGIRLVDMPGVGERWLCRVHAGEIALPEARDSTKPATKEPATAPPAQAAPSARERALKVQEEKQARERERLNEWQRSIDKQHDSLGWKILLIWGVALVSVGMLMGTKNRAESRADCLRDAVMFAEYEYAEWGFTLRERLLLGDLCGIPGILDNGNTEAGATSRERLDRWAQWEREALESMEVPGDTR